ncbi:MAG TPA: JDVT-CTERM system glutamic-type intramembrane protease [Caldimonas sp.]|nr:JDVT-CTERM system glutamic-type intramembrane protease [Caldimonas sp.]
MSRSDRPLVDIAWLCVASVAEEVVFRGVLQPWLAKRFGRRLSAARLTPANLLTSAVFAALHAWRHPVAVAAGVFPVSLVYGIARERSGSVVPPALLHAGFNVLLYAASWLVGPR